MKTLRKYANMAFLLVSAATIIPAYGKSEITVNEQEIVVNQEKATEKTEPVFSLRDKLGSVLVLGGIIALYLFMLKQEKYRFSKENLEKYGIKPTKE